MGVGRFRYLYRVLRLHLIVAFILFGTVSSGFSDVRIILDVSKSMAENDPQNFRGEALQLLVDSIPNGEKAGLWTFGQYVNLLVPHETVNNQWRTDAVNRIKQQGAPAVRTNIGRALEDASYDFLFSNYKAPTHVVLITDGRVDIAPNDSVNRVERERILNQLVPKFAAANARVHTVAISDKADHALLKQISEQTGGQYQSVSEARNLSRVLGKLSSEVSPINQLKIDKKSFDVDQSVREITVLMYHSEGAVSLIAPNGEETSAVKPADQRWRVGNGFSQVSLSSPMQGRWEFKGQLEENSSIRVISDVNLVWKNPENTALARGELVSIEAMVVDGEGKSISSDLGAIVQERLRVNGALVPSQIQRDKIIARIVPDKMADSIALEVMVDGGTFSRLMTRTIRFVDPYISEVLLTEKGYEWRIYPNRYLASVDSIDAQASYELNGQPMTGEFTQTNAGYWVWVMPLTTPSGVYDVTLAGQLSQNDQAVMLPNEAIRLSFPPSANSAMAMTPKMLEDPFMAMNVDEMPEPMPEGASDAFVKDPMPEFEELQADIIVSSDDNGEWSDEVTEDMAGADEDGSGIAMQTYILLSIPGILVLALAYLFYRRIEQKSNMSVSEEELLLGGDEFSGLDDLDALSPDSDLDIASFEGFEDDPMADAEMSEEDLPPRTQTEAPNAAEEDMLDAEPPVISQEAETVEDPEEELFDISSIDDDLADLDLALDGDDPFADDPDENRT